MQGLCNIIRKVQDKSPLKYLTVRQLVCLDPSVMYREPERCRNHMKGLVQRFLQDKQLTDTSAGDVILQQFDSLLSLKSRSEDFLSFPPMQKRLDVFLCSAMEPYPELWAFCKKLLILSHGQATVERGFSINKEVESDNLKEDTVVTRRLVCDYIIQHGGVTQVPLSKQLLASVARARTRYRIHLETNRKNKEAKDQALKRKEAEDCLQELKFDVKNQRMFLRRTKYSDIHQEDLFVGSRINVFSRQLNLIEYGDQYTANNLSSKKERTLALIKPDMITKIGDVLELIYSSNLMVTKAKMTKLTRNLVQFVSSGPVVAMELMGAEALSIWRRLLGPADSAVEQGEVPQSIRAQCGTDGIKNVCHGSDSLAAAARELEFFFPSTIGQSVPNTATFIDCTCCIIKPHAVSEGITGNILNSISAAGFEISALQMFSMERANAEEFYEVYKGIVSEYPNMVTELCSGPCLVLEITGANVTKTFREFCGPADPEVAQHLRPNTLRALYGKDKVKNAVHCTDLPEDGVLEAVGLTHRAPLFGKTPDL
uniref:Nucleoside diphosphate kinase B n=1 Tax=Gouania willdenowi TaxID=441366 RepID=A0A8C5N3G3_GOUWI